MVDTIRTGNRWSRVSSTPPVKRVKRRHESHPDRDFRRDLKKKERKKDPKGGREDQSTDHRHPAHRRTKGKLSEGNQKQRTPDGAEKQTNDGPGKIIDIHS